MLVESGMHINDKYDSASWRWHLQASRHCRRLAASAVHRDWLVDAVKHPLPGDQASSGVDDIVDRL